MISCACAKHGNAFILLGGKEVSNFTKLGIRTALMVCWVIILSRLTSSSSRFTCIRFFIEVLVCFAGWRYLETLASLIREKLSLFTHICNTHTFCCISIKIISLRASFSKGDTFLFLYRVSLDSTITQAWNIYTFFGISVKIEPLSTSLG